MYGALVALPTTGTFAGIGFYVLAIFFLIAGLAGTVHHQ